MAERLLLAFNCLMVSSAFPAVLFLVALWLEAREKPSQKAKKIRAMVACVSALYILYVLSQFIIWVVTGHHY